MDVEHVKTTLEPYYIRSRVTLKVIIRVAALAVVLLASFNIFAPALGYEAFAVYPRKTMMFVERGGYFIEDVFVLFAGLIVAWVV